MSSCPETTESRATKSKLIRNRKSVLSGVSAKEFMSSPGRTQQQKEAVTKFELD